MTVSDRAKDAFLEVVELPEQEWAPRLRELCDGDEHLEACVMELLDAHRDAGEFLSTPTVNGTPVATAGAPIDYGIVEGPGSRIGQYALIRQLGEGGFGVVFEAEQSTPIRRSVALKIIKPGMDTRQVVARLQVEQQMLAILEHPHIAKVFDADTTPTGRPYFVMELVEGVPITQFCRDKNLSLRERLGLFDLVCDAARHAHQKGVIHRDIKPNNVLVSGTRDRPIPKMIDFGVAKAMHSQLADPTQLTHDQQIIGTPQYMSPEQAAPGEHDIDTRSDVYSLGVLLYEILTGTTPLEPRRVRDAKLADVQQMICEEVPQKPSTRVLERSPQHDGRAERTTNPVSKWHRQLRGDLDTIVMTALHKDRERRYASVERFSDDIRRYLLDLPISARGDSVWYRTRRFVSRHRTSVIAGAVVLFSLTLGFIVTYRSGRMAERQRDAAIQNLYEAYIAQARAARSSKKPGRREGSLAVLKAAAAIRPSLELRNEAIACMSLSDVVIDQTHGAYPAAVSVGLAGLNRWTYLNGDHQLTVHFEGRFTADELFIPLTEPIEPARRRFSPHGRYLTAGYASSNGHRLEVWDTDARSRVVVLDPVPEVCRFAFSSKETWMIGNSTTDGLTVFDLPSGEIRQNLSFRETPRAIALSSNDRWAALSHLSDNAVTVVDVTTGKAVATLACPATINALAWRPDGMRLAGAGADCNVYIWNTVSWELVQVLSGHQGEVRQVFWHPNGEYLATNSWDNTARIWDVRSGEQILDPLQSWYFQGFGDRLLARSRTNTLATWKFIRSDTFRRMFAEDSLGSTSTPDFIVGCDFLLTAGTNGAILWNIDKGTKLMSITTEPLSAARFIDPATILLAGPSGLIRRRLERGADGHTPVPVEDEEVLWARDGLKRMDLSADRSMVAICDMHDLYLFDLTQKKLLRTIPGYAGIIRPRLSPDGQWVFTGTWKGEPARLWNLKTGDVLQEFKGPHVIGDFSPDGAYLIVSSGNAFRMLETGSWKPIRVFDRSAAVDDLAGKMAFSPDGQMLALGQSRYVVKLFHLGTGEELAELTDPLFLAQSELTFTPDSQKLISVTTDRVVQVWDLRRIRERLRSMGLDW